MSVFLYIPNLIGYLRVYLLGVAVYHGFSDFRVFFVAYSASQLLDAADGWAARKFKQSSAFGAVLDMVTDRVSSNLLLLVLANLHFQYFFFFAFLAALDYASHWTQMYASVYVGNSSHKNISVDRPWLLRVYYTNKAFLFLNCLCQEAALLALYLLHFHPLPGVSHDFLFACLVASAPLGLLKQIINLVQLVDASKLIVRHEQDALTKPSSAARSLSPKTGGARKRAASKKRE